MKDDMRWVKTHCARMDHGGCALLVGLKENRIVSVKGDPDGFLNKGYICAKGLASPDRLTHPERLRYPLRRAGKKSPILHSFFLLYFNYKFYSGKMQFLTIGSLQLMSFLSLTLTGHE